MTPKESSSQFRNGRGPRCIHRRSFLITAIEGGNTLKTYSHRGEAEDGLTEDTSWVGLHRFFGLYVVNCTLYGEGQDDYGPFAERKDAKAAFDYLTM